MKLDNEDKLLIGAGVVALGTLGFFYFKNKKKNQAQTIDIAHEEVQPKQIPSAATPPISNNSGAQDYDPSLIMQKGSEGFGVKVLQKLLGFKTQDGKFGNKTLAALRLQKGVDKISIYGWSATANVKPKKPVVVDKPFAKGQRIQVNIRNGFTARDVKTKADGTYFTTSTNVLSGLDFGDEVGVIQAVMTAAKYGKAFYVVKNNFLGVDRLLWVSHSDVALFAKK